MKTIKGYADLYLKCEVLLLANVLFRSYIIIGAHQV